MVIVMTGLPGTGKSAIAARLRVALSAALLDKDRVRAALFGPDQIAYSTEQDDWCMGIVLQAAAYLLRSNRALPIIIDGRPFARRYQLQQVDAFAAEQVVPLNVIYCVCSDATARARLDRDAAGAAHLAANRGYAMYQQLKATFEPIREPKLVVDTDNDLDQCVRQALAFIKPQPGDDARDSSEPDSNV